MKTAVVVLLMLCGVAVGQHGFTPVFDKPAEFERVTDTYAWVKGHWVEEHMVGPESSDISCDKKDGTCTDTQANISVIGGMFVMSGDVTEYTVARWNKSEIVAVVEGRAPCHLRQVLKIDRVGKRVTWMISLSEPLDGTLPEMTQKMCTLGQMTLELKDGTAWGMR